jgi:simple sugar transport system substrate-binding protein
MAYTKAPCPFSYGNFIEENGEFGMNSTINHHDRKRQSKKWQWCGSIVTLSLFLGACGTSNNNAPTTNGSPSGDFTIGLVLVGPKNDAGWSQGHYEGIEETVKQVPGTKFEYVDKVNPADRPNVKGTQVADDLIAKGAKIVFFTSDDFKDDALEAAKKHPNIPIIHASGDYAWKEGKNYKNQPNLGNIMARMEYGKMIAGCAAALSSPAGKIGMVGPLINDETRRYASAAYLGAKHCWQTYRQKKAEELTFKITWIGFWFNIPGKTLDPTKVADDFYNSGFDVVMSAIDTPEVAIQGKKAAEAGKKVKFVHYDYKKGCDLAPEICIGVPYYNWHVPYIEAVKQAKAGSIPNQFVWLAPDWQDINNSATSMLGFMSGKALGDQQKNLDDFVKKIADKSINLYQGPLKLQDGSEFVPAGAVATDQQIWYMSQLFQGMEGQSK